MLYEFITVLIIEISQFLIANKTFFEESSAKREELLGSVKLPNTVKAYLTSTNEQDLMNHFKGIVQYLNDHPVKLEENKLAEAIVQFLASNFANDIYALPSNYFKLNYTDQQEVIDKVINSNSQLAKALKRILTDYSYQEILNGIQVLASETFNSPLVVVQSPLEIDLETKKEIRDNLNQSLQKPCLPIFQVNTQLIGGLRIFVNGQVTDLSWIARINLITSLK